LALDATMVTAATLVLGAPIAPVVLGWIRNRIPLVAPPMVLCAAVILAAAIAVAAGLFGSPAPLAVAAPILSAAIVARVPDVRERAPMILVLLATGWLGGAGGLALFEPRVASQLQSVLDRGVAGQSRVDALALGGATIERDGVLVDTDNAPAVVLGRGQGRGLIAPADPEFTLALLFGRIDIPFVAVPDPHSAAGIRDRLNKAFPRLYRDGAPGYRLLYQNATWRLYARQKQAGR
jgi:hypothetical protein